MEYGLMPKINQYVDNNQLLIQQVQSSSEIAKLKSSVEAKELEKQKFLKGADEVTSSNDVSKTSKTNSINSNRANYHEVVLTNVNFGFNDSSRDFFVKATRGEIENQYPTDEMMRLKAYFIAQAKEETAV